MNLRFKIIQIQTQSKSQTQISWIKKHKKIKIFLKGQLHAFEYDYTEWKLSWKNIQQIALTRKSTKELSFFDVKVIILNHAEENINCNTIRWVVTMYQRLLNIINVFWKCICQLLLK